MLLFGLTQRHKKPSSRERGTARVLASVKTRHGRKANLVRALSGSLRDRRFRSARKSIWCNGICCKRSGSTSQLGADKPAFLVEVHEHSFCTALWSKSVGGIEDCRG